MVLVHGTATVVNEYDVATDLADVTYKVLHLKVVALSLSCFAQDRAGLLEHGYIIVDSFADPCGKNDGCSVP